MRHQQKQQPGDYLRLAYVNLAVILRAATPVNKWRRLADRSRDRYNRLNELVHTEEIYLKDLIMLKQKVQEQLLSAKIITQKQSNQMFPNIAGMISLSQQIHNDLRQKLGGWNRKTMLIGDTMCKFARAYIIYSDFFKNLHQTQLKIRNILKSSQQARSIQRSLSLPNRIISFEDLIAKPFQRPLKYHLILTDYCSKTEHTHPDYQNLQKAIALYKGVNEQNNLSVQNKQKTQTLYNLESKFGNIISESRHYITQYEAVCFQTSVIIYLFSNLAILANKKSEKEISRISLNKFSHVETAGDVFLFKNRLYFYGQKTCIHLTFAEKPLRDDCYSCLKKLIEQISRNQITRETIIIDRISRFTLTNHRRKFSFTNLEPQLQRPIVVSVLGAEERCNKYGQKKNYFVCQFYPEKLNLNASFIPHHISILSEDQITKLQTLIGILYPSELQRLSLSTISRSLVNDIQYYKNDQKRIEIKTVLLQLYLNSLFRNPIILKRIDVFVYLLKISEPIWNLLKIANNHSSQCNACYNKDPQYSKHDDYNRQTQEREYNRVNLNKKKTEYCELRTIQSQQNLYQLSPQVMSKAKVQDRIAYVKTKLGWVNQTLTNTRPCSQLVNQINLKVYYKRISNTIQFQIDCLPNDQVRKIITLIGQKRQMNFQDYALVAEMDQNALILCDDEPIGNIVGSNEDQQTFAEKVLHFITNRQELKITLCLQKYWVIFSPRDYVAPDKSRRTKVNSEVQSVLYRLASEELRMAEEEALEIYALFFCKKYFAQFRSFDYQKVAIKLRDKHEFYMSSKFQNEQSICKIYQRVQKIKQNTQLHSEFDIGVKILQNVSQKPGWSCIMFKADLIQQQTDNKMSVQIGCDLKGVRVREQKKLAFYLQFGLEDTYWTHHTSGNILIITHNQKTFKFTGRQIWKVDQQIQFYTMYLKLFGRS